MKFRTKTELLMTLEEYSDSTIAAFCEAINANRFSPIHIDLDQTIDDIFEDLKYVPLAVLQKTFDQIIEDEEVDGCLSDENDSEDDFDTESPNDESDSDDLDSDSDDYHNEE